MKRKIYTTNNEYLMEEFNHKLDFINKYLECKHTKTFELKRETILKDFREKQLYLDLNLKDSSKTNFFVSQYVKEIYSLNDIEWFCLIVSLMYKSDVKYRELLLNIESGKSLTYSALMKLYFFVDDISEIDEYYDILSVCSEKMNSLCFVQEAPILDTRLFENIISNVDNDLKIPGLSIYFPKKNHRKRKLAIRESVADSIFKFLNKCERMNSICVLIYGEKGIGKQTIVNRICSLENKGAVYINLETIQDSSFEETVLTGCREAFFTKGYICLIYSENSLDPKNNSFSKLTFALSIASKFSRIIFVLSEQRVNMNEKPPNLEYVHLNLPKLTMEESYRIWEENLSNIKLNKDIDISELASKFILTPAQVENSVSEALIQNKLKDIKVLCSQTLSKSIYNQLNRGLESKATLISKKHSIDELILNKNEKNLLLQACNQVKYRHTVYGKWGMDKRILYGNGVSMLFAGLPGTGKTMAAQVISNELDLEIYKVDLSRVISKYIGESEKNLGEILDCAKKSNVILLFDETDALFTKRTEVKDSHDRNANLETSYLLQKMEEHTGITILTTNFLENIDKAFFRRINYVVHFMLPDTSARKKIWEGIFTKEVPLSKDLDFEFLAKQFEISGGNIKNTALTAVFMAASEKTSVSMKHIIKSLQQELKKQGKMVSKEDFGEYGYLL